MTKKHPDSAAPAGQMLIYQTEDGRFKVEARLGYARWENFQTAIQCATESCVASGHALSDHFRGVTKMIVHGKGRRCEVNDEATQ